MDWVVFNSKIRPPFHPLLAKHRKLGVDWYLGWRDDYLTFSSFTRAKNFSNRLPDPRFKGLGAACFAEFLELTDQMGLAVCLYCGVPKLFSLYESFGFVCISEEKYEGDYLKRKYRREPPHKGDQR